MAAKMRRTRHPGIYRRGSRYVVTYRVDGKQHKESVPTLKTALALKAARMTDRDRGEFQEFSRRRFRKYAEEWIDTYQGTGKRGFTEGSRDAYRRDLERYAYPFLDARLGRTVSSLTPRDITRWIAWLTDEKEQGRLRAEYERRKLAEKRNVPVSAVPAPSPEPLRLSDASIRRIVAPVRACLATAKRQGDIRHNPCDGCALPHRPRVDDEMPKARALAREQLAMFLRVVHPEKRLMFRFVAATGLRFPRWSRFAGETSC